MASTRESRLKLIDSIQKKRESIVICYITSDRSGIHANIAGDAVDIINNHLLENEVKSDSNVDLYLYSRGGDADVPWKLVSKIREYIPNGRFSVIIPYRCHSAATVISLGADEIVMTAQAELGPIDATIVNGPHNPYDEITKRQRPVSVEDVTGFFNLLRRASEIENGEKLSENTILEAYSQLSEKVDPLVLGAVDRLLEQTKFVATKLIESRNNNKSDIDAKSIVRKLSSEIFSHNHAISRTEAKNDIGLNWVEKAEDKDIDEEVWQLYREYEAYFKLNKSFNPEQKLIAAGADEMDFKNINIACVESATRFDVARKSIRIKRLKATPNQVNFNIGNIGLPSISIPEIEGITPQQVMQIIQQYLQTVVPNVIKKTAADVKEQFIKALPDQGFQRSDIGGGWHKI